MLSPSKHIKDILEADTSLVFGTDLFIGLGPTTPDNIVVLRDTGGRPPVAQYSYEYPTIQVYVRNNSYESGWNQIEVVKACLHAITNRVCGAERFILILASSEIMYLGNDENDRAEFSLNFEIHRTE